MDAEAALDLVHVERTVLHYGKGERNPVLAMRFLDLPNRHGRGGRGGGDGGGGGQNGGSTRVGRQVDEDQVCMPWGGGERGVCVSAGGCRYVGMWIYTNH